MAICNMSQAVCYCCWYACAGASNTDRPSVNDLEGGLSSEAVGIDESAIDAIPAESMPAGANRTEGPQPGISAAAHCMIHMHTL